VIKICKVFPSVTFYQRVIGNKRLNAVSNRLIFKKKTRGVVRF